MLKFKIYSFSVFLIILISSGCSIKVSSWQSSIWENQDKSAESKNVGKLSDSRFNYDIAVTDLRKITRYPGTEGGKIIHPKILIGIAVRCYNNSDTAQLINDNPIQVISLDKILSKELTQDEVIFKFYGGKTKEMTQISELNTLNDISRNSNNIFIQILSDINKKSVIDDMHSKEYDTYEVFHKSFSPISIPSGVSYDWVQYHNYIQGPIKVILKDQSIDNGIIFNISNHIYDN